MAAPFDWAADVPAGAIKNHSLSKKIRREAIARCEVLPFCKEEPGFGKKKGEKHTITRILQLAEPVDPTIAAEGASGITADELTVQAVEITVALIGRQVPYTEFAKELLHFDLQSVVQEAIIDQQKVSLDTRATRLAFAVTPLKYVATGAASGVFESTTATQTCASNLNVFHIGKMASRLRSVQKAKPVDGDNFVGIFNTVSYEGVMDDDTFAEWVKYTTPEKMYKNEVGRIRGTRIIETNHTAALGELEGGVAGEGIVFGDDAGVMVEALPPELRMKIDPNFGLSPAVAWVGIVGFGTPWDTFALARCVHFTTAP